MSTIPEIKELTADEMEMAKKLSEVIRSPILNRLIESHEEIREARDKYATAARSIALNLSGFCDESLPVDEMIAAAARRVDVKIRTLRENEKMLTDYTHRADLKMEKIRQIAISGIENPVADAELLRGYLVLILQEFGIDFGVKFTR